MARGFLGSGRGPERQERCLAPPTQPFRRSAGGLNAPPSAISLFSRWSEMSTGTLGLVVTVAVSPLAGM